MTLVFGALALTSNRTVDPIAQAASASTKQLGFRMNMRFAISSPALGTPIAASGTAVVDPPDRTASMSMSIDTSHLPQAAQALGSGTLQVALIVVGQHAYVKLPQALVNKVPKLGGKPWVEVNVTKATGVPGLSSLGGASTVDPGAMLQKLLAGADGVSNQGQRIVDGVQTTHYRAQLSLAHAFATVPSPEQALMQKLLAGAGVPVDVWIDSNHLVRRIGVSLALNSPSGPALQATFTADITDYGPQPRPVPPPADQVTDASSAGAGLVG